jgi:hypothetical protein
MADMETFIIGEREYTCVRMNAFAANKLFLRLQKIAVPVLSVIAAQNGSLGDLDVKEAGMMLAEHLDDDLIDSVVLPMLDEARVYSVEHKRRIKAPTDIDICFTAAELLDFYELVFLVGRHQFGPFIRALAKRFGGLIAENPKAQ